MKNKILKIVLAGIIVLNMSGFAHASKLGKKKKIVEKPSINIVLSAQVKPDIKREKIIKQNNSYIGADRARAIALSRVKGANNSHIRKLKLDYKNGRPVYKGEIKYRGWEYDFEIDAVTGKILEWERDRD